MDKDQQKTHEPQVPQAAQADLEATLAEIQGLTKAPEQSVEPVATPAEPQADPTPAGTTPTQVDPEPQAGQRTEQPEALGLQLVPPVEGAPKATPGDTDVWKNKYRSEVPRLHAFVKQKDAEIARLTERVAELEKGSTSTGKTKAGDVSDLLSLIPEETVDDLGEKNVRNILQALAQNRPQPEPSIDAIELRQMVEQQKLDRFFSDLDALVPNWETVGDSEPFKQFCGEYDPLSNLKYQHIIDVARANGDAAQAAEVFNRFAGTSSTPKQATNRPTVGEQVVPDGRSTPMNTTPTTDTRRTYTLEKWDELMTRAATRTNLSPQQAVELEKELQSAMSEGRVLDNGQPVNIPKTGVAIF